jgi:hypothetical protein
MMLSSPKNKIAVVYLARKEQSDHFQSFIESYKNYSAGICHDLFVIFKGYHDKDDLDTSQKKFSDLIHTPIILPDTGFDLGSYYQVASMISHEYVCFLNTYSQILGEGWLSKIHQHISDPRVGIVGASGSHEGIGTSVEFLQKAIWLYTQCNIPKPLRESILNYFQVFLPSESLRTILRRLLQRFCGNNGVHHKENYPNWWKKMRTIPEISELVAFPCFPNPHIRTTGFMIQREIFLKLSGKPFKTKLDACHFESGSNNMTRQLLQSGLKALVVGRNGSGYEVQDWCKSSTFRYKDQNNLLIGDNHTRSYHSLTASSQLTYSYMTWGKPEILLPEDFPELGLEIQPNLSPQI